MARSCTPSRLNAETSVRPHRQVWTRPQLIGDPTLCALEVPVADTVRCDAEMTVRTLAERTGAPVGAVQTGRCHLLERLSTEPPILRSWRRMRARWALRRSWAVDQHAP